MTQAGLDPEIFAYMNRAIRALNGAAEVHESQTGTDTD
jgi:hypothetical protein